MEDIKKVSSGHYIFEGGVEDALVNMKSVESMGGFSEAIQAVGSTPVALSCSSALFCDYTRTIPSTVTLVLLPGFSCVIAGGATLTLNCAVIAFVDGWAAKFTGSGTFVNNAVDLALSGGAGPTGPAVTGPTGASGAPSTVTGPASTVTGPTGASGAASTVAGPTGASGEIGITGASGAASTVPGPTGISGEASTVTGPKGGDGPTGASGEASTVTGPTGPDNATITGPTGASGEKGDQGITGASGEASTVPGPTGPDNATITGPTGATGASGAASTVPGPTGASGSGVDAITIGGIAVTITNPQDGDILVYTTTGPAWINQQPA
jgi:hypothetical protein